MSERPTKPEADELAYEHAVRALDQQAGVLDSVRGRTAVLIAAMSLVATFLGGQALTATNEHRVFDYLATVPLLALAVGVFLAVRVLQPTKKDRDTQKTPDEREGLQLTVNAIALLDSAPAGQGSEESIRAFVARCAQAQWESNDEIIDDKLDEFTNATWALLVQVGLWIVLLIGKGVS